MDKKLPLESIVRTACHYSTCQNIKFNNSRFNERHTFQIVPIINDTKSINRHGSFVASIEKYPRSYAEMITDYSENLYKVSTIGTRNDSLYFDNTIRKSPFSTFSIPSSIKKIVNVTEHSKAPIEENNSSLPSDAVESLDRCIQHNNVNTVKYHDFQQHRDMRIVKTINKVSGQDCIVANDLKNDDQSYAKLVADCSKSVRNISLASISNGGLVLSKNVLARNSLESFVTPRKANSTNTQEILRKTSLTAATIPFEKNVKEQLSVPKKHNWLKEIESVTGDSKSVIEERAKAKVIKISNNKSNESNDISQFVDTSDNSRHKILRLTKLIKIHKQKAKGTAKSSCQSDEIDEMEKHDKDFALKKHNYSQLSDKRSISDLPRHFSTVTKSPFARKNSTHATSGTTRVLKQPQVKLRMVPSEKESVVSINVDSVSPGLLDPLNPASKQLSVVVQSDRKEDPQSTENQGNISTLRRGVKSAPQRGDFGPMRISISEDSAPIKQIEFSINGKPVSELKSIIARTERLDVVSSMDKIEIRIPFVKDDVNSPSKTEETDLSKGTDASTSQILNVQISANFQNEFTKGSVEKSRETLRYVKDTTSASLISNNYSFDKSIKAREDIFNNNNMQQYGFSDNKNINEHKALGDNELNIQRETEKNISTDKTMTDISLFEERNNSEILNSKKMMNTTQSSSTNKYDKNEFSNHRISSKMIPWWSSSDSFNKIRKKEEDFKLLASSSNRNEKKAISNLNHNLVTESLPSKWKKTPNSTLTKKIQSINDATINNSSNFTSYTNSVESSVESKPTLHYRYSFRLKPNKGNPSTISEIMRNDLKTKDNQIPAAQEDNKFFGIKQVRPVPLSTFGGKNLGEHDIREKASVLQKKTLNSAQNLSAKKNQEKKDNYLLKQTKSNDDVLRTKSKIENISENTSLKLIEKRKDTSIDYNLKISSKQPIVRLNSQVKEIENPPADTIITKNSMSNTSATEMREQIAKTIKQPKLDKTKKLEIEMNILKQKEKEAKENLTVKNVATDVKTQNKNDDKNTQQMHKNKVTTLNSPNFINSLKSTQTLKKQKSTEYTIAFQDNSEQKNKKSLLKNNEDKPSSSSEESKQNRPKSLSNIKNTLETLQGIEKLRSLTLSNTLQNNPSKESLDKKMINQKKSPLEIINKIQTKYNVNTNKIANIDNQPQTKSKSNITSKIENVTCKNSMDKNAKEMPDEFVKKMDKKDHAKDITARITTQNSNIKDSLSKNCERNHLDKLKSGKDKRNPSGSADSLSRKPNGSTGFKSADSKTKSTVMSNDNCTYPRKSMLMEALYPNFNRKDDIMSNSQSAMFKIPRNLHNDMLEHPAPRVIENVRPWINMDRPEKSMLYSAWLQRSRNDINKDEKLF